MSLDSLTEDLLEASRLLAELERRGMYIAPMDPDGLWVGPPDSVDDQTRSVVRKLKPVILEILKDRRPRPCVQCGKFSFRYPTVCHWCRRTDEKPGHA